MKTWKIIGLLMVGTCAFQACDKDDDDIDNDDEIEFVSKAASSNLFEIQTGELAVTRGVDTEVKTFGANMVSDHTTASVELQQVASQNGIAVPSNMSQDHQNKYNELSQKNRYRFRQSLCSANG